MDENIYCTNCNVEMEDGYTICDGLQNYCSDKCLSSEFTEAEYKELYDMGYAFWTTYKD